MLISSMTASNYPNMASQLQDESLNTLTKLLNCPTCFKILENPTTLSCGHTICSGCCPSNDYQIKCPIENCQRIHTSLAIKPDVVIGGIIDIYKNYIESFLSMVQSRDLSSCPSIQLDLSNQLECNVCYTILYDPVTTPCGHTFCRHCIIRALDYKDQCPFCRSTLFNFHSAFSHSPNHLIHALTSSFFSQAIQIRSLSLQNEKQLHIDETPIFIFSLAFPTSVYNLHFFEPRYRLMIRRCLESGKRRFGMALNNEDGSGYKGYGTMLEIKRWECLPDGRFVVVTQGIYRFKILSRSMRDGYHVAKIERLPELPPIDDLLRSSPDSSEGCQPTSTQLPFEEIKNECLAFVQALKNSNIPWLMDRLTFGTPSIPEDPSDFSFWVASVIPMNDHEKYPILLFDNYMDRLILIRNWIHRIQSQWWYKKLC